MVNNLIRKKPNRLLIARNNYYSNGGIFRLIRDGFKNMSITDLAGAIGGAAGSTGNALLSLGKTSTAGNIVGGIGNAMSTLPGIGGIIGGAANLLGGGINALFGSKINLDKVNAINELINNANNFTSNANSFDDLTNMFANQATVGLFNQKDVGKDGLFSNKAKNLNNKLQGKAALARLNVSNQLANNTSNLINDLIGELLANYSAYGGPLFAFGGSISRNKKYEDGGDLGLDGMIKARIALDSHFGNPTARRMTNYDTRSYTFPNGEKGNVYVGSYDNYVTPHIQDVDGELKFIEEPWNEKNWRRSEVQSMKFENPRDAKYFGENYKKFAPMMSLYSKEFGFGGKVGTLTTNGGDFSMPGNFISINNGGTHENNPYEGVPMGIDLEGTPNLVEEGEVIFNDYVFSKRLKVPELVKDKYKLKGNKSLTFADAALQMAKESEERPNDPISKAGLEDSMMKLMIALELIREKKNSNKNTFKTGGKLGNLFLGIGQEPNFLRRRGFEITPFYGEDPVYITGGYNSPAETKGGNLVNPDMPYVSTPPPITNDIQGSPALESRVPSPVALAAAIETIATRNTVNGTSNTSTSKDKNIAPTWMRYIPAYASGIMSITDALGLTNKPDYSDADALLNYSRNAGVYQPVSFKPVGNYLTYNPFDIEYAANQANAESAAARRAIMNTSGGNRATAMAGILAADNNALNQLGILRRGAAEDNRTHRREVETFNRETNTFNSEGLLNAATANQQALMNARSTFLNGALNAIELRLKERLASAANRSANLSNFINSLGDIGRENFARNMIISDPSKYYSINSNGVVSYNKNFSELSDAEQDYVRGHATRIANSKKTNKAAKGGYLTIKRRKK